jgi:hypothetical protein
MEKTTLGTRGGNRNPLTVSHEEWKKAGKPDGWLYDSRTGKGRLLTPAERLKARMAQKRAERRLSRDPKHLRARLEAHKAAALSD